MHTYKAQALITLAALLSNSPIAYSEGSAKLLFRLFDTRTSGDFVLEPTAETSFFTTAEPLAGRVTFKATPQKQIDESLLFDFSLKEANISYPFYHWSIAVGRTLLRPIAYSLNDGIEAFLQTEPSLDGLNVQYDLSTISLRAFGGGARTAGLAALLNTGNLTFSFLYVGRRNSLQNEVAAPSSNTTLPRQRAVHTQDWEIGILYQGDDVTINSLFQGRQLGAFRFIESTGSQPGEFKTSGIDPDLPRSSANYHAVTQFTYFFANDPNQTMSASTSIAGSNSPRYNVSNKEDPYVKQGEKNQIQGTLSLESTRALIRAQLGIALEHSEKNYLSAWSSASYRF